MRAALIALVASLGACAEPTPARYYQDIELWREPWGPGSYAECESMTNTFGCEYRVRLCSNSTMNVLLGDAIIVTTYYLDGDVAISEHDNPSARMTIDLETLEASNNLGSGWMHLDGRTELLDCPDPASL